MAVTVWSMLEQCVSQLDEPFHRSEITGWFRRHYPDVLETTLSAHIQAATANAPNRAQNNPLGRRQPLIERIDRGVYRRARKSEVRTSAVLPASPASVSEVSAIGLDTAVTLVGCVKTKAAIARPASELYLSPLFEGRRLYALKRGLPWYILSARFGLLAPDEVIGPYDMYLPDQSPAYRNAWGEFTAAHLEQLQPDLRGRAVEVHAGAAYAEALRAPLARRGITLLTPLASLNRGQQVAWYKARETRALSSPEPSPQGEPVGDDADASELTRRLTDPSLARSPCEFLAAGPDGLRVPGLYSWWADDTGAADLSRGLGLPVAAGLIYAGQAGATRWPSGKRSAGTLWDRITGMHLGGAAEFSTFRRTLAAILRPVFGLASEDDPKVSAWINAHLSVITAPVPDPDRLGQIEAAVLAALDPPLNLHGRPPSAIRARLRQLRRDGRADSQATASPSDPSDLTREPTLTPAEQQFHRAMIAIYETAKRDLGYNATRFLQMVSEHGGLATARQLLWSGTPSDGFTTLWQHKRLDLTVEAHILRHDFASLFTDEDRQQARDRLEQYGWPAETHS